MVLHGRIRTGLDRWFSKILRIRSGSDSTFTDQDWSRTEQFHSLLISETLVSSQISDLYEISDLLFYVSYFTPQNKEIKFGNYIF